MTDDVVGKATKREWMGSGWGQYWEPVCHDLDLDHPLRGQPREYRVYNFDSSETKEEADTCHEEEVG